MFAFDKYHVHYNTTFTFAHAANFKFSSTRSCIANMASPKVAVSAEKQLMRWKFETCLIQSTKPEVHVKHLKLYPKALWTTWVLRQQNTLFSSTTKLQKIIWFGGKLHNQNKYISKKLISTKWRSKVTIIIIFKGSVYYSYQITFLDHHYESRDLMNFS